MTLVNVTRKDGAIVFCFLKEKVPWGCTAENEKVRYDDCFSLTSLISTLSHDAGFCVFRTKHRVVD